MDYQEVKSLLEAGFTADEIRDFMRPSNNPQNSQIFAQPEKTNIQNTEPVKDSENKENAAGDQPGSQPDPSGADDKIPNIPNLDKLNESISKLIRTIQASNLHNNSMPTPQQPDIEKQVDSIMASVIRPEHNTKGD